MPNNQFLFGKIAATPNSLGWSQSYSAGNLFLAISLTQDQELSENHLNIIGKNFINSLEAEFFTLKEKSMESIKNLLQTLCSEIAESVKYSVVLGLCKNDILYIFICGPGGVIIKRDERSGVILEETDPSSKNIKASSGKLQHDDLIFAYTHQFNTIITQDTLISSLQGESINDILEIITPLVHKNSEGGAAAVILNYKAQEDEIKDEHPKIDLSSIVEDNTEDVKILEEKIPVQEASKIDQKNLGINNIESFPQATAPTKRSVPKITTLFFSLIKKLNHRQKMLLGIILLLIFALILSIYFTTQSAQNKKVAALFEKTYEPAKKYYEDGMGLMELNTSLAVDELKKAQKLLKEAESQIPQNTEEGKKITELLNKTNNLISSQTGSKDIESKTVDDSVEPSLKILKSKKDLISSAQDNNNIYALSKSSVFTYDKDGSAEKEIIKNNSDWTTPVDIAVFYGNIYILDKKEGVIKYTKTDDGYSKSSYFQGEPPDFSKAEGLAIDSSVYVLFSDGSVQKYTRASVDSYEISGLEKPLRSPARIYTDENLSSVYILSPQNGILVKTDKSGAVQSQYSSKILSEAKNFTVREDKKAFVLSENKIFEINLE